MFMASPVRVRRCLWLTAATASRGSADVLVHSVMYPSAIDRLVGRVPNAAALKESILAHLTSAEDAGLRCQDARALSPGAPDDPRVTERIWIEAAQSHFHGKVILGRDLLEI